MGLTDIVINGAEVALLSEKFMLREQSIGEIRGLKRAQQCIESKLKELKDSEKPDSNENEFDSSRTDE